MLRVNGLFGWIRSNDQRSLVLFGGFVVALQLAAALTLYLPLAGLDRAHAPFLNWGGYALRYVPLVFIAGVLVFGAQMYWHVHSVRRLVPFHFVDHSDERRLCDIIEPLTIGMGLPAPYVGVIETSAMNAFACGIRRKDAVIVVTRGLIDGLDDEELGAVVAHELAHIANGDIRLMASANICLGMLRRLMLPRRNGQHPIVEIMTVPILLFVMPPMFVAALMLTTLGQLSVRAGHLVRALIGASREFIADAAAVEATQNPAALVSALKRIEGRSRIAGMPPGQDAMMIDGAAAGAFATHPSIGQRIKAVVAVTGSMALIAPSRRDTRARAGDGGGGFGRRAPAPAAAQAPLTAAAADAEAYDGRNWLGLSRGATISATIALIAFLGIRGYETRDPFKVLALFDPRPAIDLVVILTGNLSCGIAGVAGLSSCTANMEAATKALANRPGGMGHIAEMMSEGGTQRFGSVDGMPTDNASSSKIAAETTAKRCFKTESYTVGRFGLHPVVPGATPNGEYAIDRWLASGDESARAVVAAGAAPDAALTAYLDERKDRLRVVHAYFDDAGLRYGLQRYAEGDHPAALAVLRTRLQDPTYLASLTPRARAEMKLLADQPDDFISCEARRLREGGPATAAAGGLRPVS